MGRVRDRSGQAAARVAVLLEEAARQARRQRTVTRAVRAAWDVLVAAGPVAGGQALACWQRAHGHDGPVGELYGAVCLAAGSPAGVAASLYRAAGTTSRAPKGAVA